MTRRRAFGHRRKHDDSHSLYHDFTTKLKERWSVEDEGELSDLLGIEFSRKDGVIQLCQRA